MSKLFILIYLGFFFIHVVKWLHKLLVYEKNVDKMDKLITNKIQGHIFVSTVQPIWIKLQENRLIINF